MIVVIYKGKGREGTKQVPFTSKALAIKKAKERYLELDEIYSEVHLLKVEKEIPM